MRPPKFQGGSAGIGGHPIAFHRVGLRLCNDPVHICGQEPLEERLHNMSARALTLIALIVRAVVARVGAPRRRRLSCEGRSLRPVTEAECAPLSEEEILALHSCDHESLRVGDLCEGDGGLPRPLKHRAIFGRGIAARRDRSYRRRSLGIASRA